MERNRIRSLLDAQAQRYMELSDKLKYEGGEPLGPEDYKLIRFVLTQYFFYGSAAGLKKSAALTVEEE